MKINLGKLEEVHAIGKNCEEVNGMRSEVESWGGKKVEWHAGVYSFKLKNK